MTVENLALYIHVSATQIFIGMQHANHHQILAQRQMTPK